MSHDAENDDTDDATIINILAHLVICSLTYKRHITIVLWYMFYFFFIGQLTIQLCAVLMQAALIMEIILTLTTQ